jgi:hypothetical protein
VGKIFVRFCKTKASLIFLRGLYLVGRSLWGSYYLCTASSLFLSDLMGCLRTLNATSFVRFAIPLYQTDLTGSLKKPYIFRDFFWRLLGGGVFAGWEKEKAPVLMGTFLVDFLGFWGFSYNKS